MTSARYLLRFDDICPTMNWEVWEEVEFMLERHDVRPLLAVVPDNQISALRCSSPAPDFWARVRAWQARGWNIGLHGFQHRFITADAGLIGLNPFSEFAGLSAALQTEKLRQALTIFAQEGITAEAWVAPAHSFDETTLQCLTEVGLRVVSDGLFLYPQTDAHGMFWVPQQLSGFRWFPFGVFTVCLHINQWERTDLQALEQQIIAYRQRLTSLPEIMAAYQHRRPRLDAVALTKLGATALKLKQRLRLRSRFAALQRTKTAPGLAE